MALKRATFDLSLGQEAGQNIIGNMERNNEKLRKALHTNEEMTGDVSLSSGLLNDLEKRKAKDRLIFKVIVLLVTLVILYIVFSRFLFRH
jgi:hypothetical protein